MIGGSLLPRDYTTRALDADFLFLSRFSVAFGIVCPCFSAQAAFSLMACQSFLIFLDVRRDTIDGLPVPVRMLFSYPHEPHKKRLLSNHHFHLLTSFSATYSHSLMSMIALFLLYFYITIAHRHFRSS